MRCRRLGAILIGLLGLQGAQAGAATSNLCLRNVGNAALEVGYLHDGLMAGGWQAHGWFRLEPGGWNARCTPVTNTGMSADWFYLAVRQQGLDGRWGWVAFDVHRINWEDRGIATVGGTFELKPRNGFGGQSTPIVGLPRGTTGIRRLVCMPRQGFKRVALLRDATACHGDDALALVSIRLSTPRDGGALETNLYDVNFRSDAAATVIADPAAAAPSGQTLPSATSPSRVPVGPDPVSRAAYQDGLSRYRRGDYAGAAFALRKAADMRHPGAQYTLGSIYLHHAGEPGQRDLVQAEAWFRRAAELGHVEAQYEMGLIFDEGRGKPVDRNAAVAWYEKAAAEGHARARQRLEALRSSAR